MPAHIVHLLSTFEVGAAQLRLAALIRAWGDRYRHTVVSLDRRTRARDLVPGELDVGVIGPLAPSASTVAVRRLIGLLRPDLMMIDGMSLPPALLAVWRRQGPAAVVVLEGPGEVRFGAALRMVAHGLIRRVWPLVVPDPMLGPAVAADLGLSEERITAIADGAHLDDPRPARPVPGLQRRPGEIVVGAFLPPDSRHLLDQLVGAFAQAPHRSNARLVIIGEGPDRRRLGASADRQGIAGNVLFTGHLGDPTAVLGEVDLFAVAPLHACVPAGLLDAMARGRPVIGCGEASLAGMVGAPNRDFIVEPGRAATLTARLDALLRSSQLRRHLGWVNREHAATRPFARTAETWRALVERCLAQRSD